MKDLDLSVSTAAAASIPPQAGFLFAQPPPPPIKAVDAEELLLIQAGFVAAGQRANMKQVRLRAPGSSHFAGVERNARAVGLLVSDVDLRNQVSRLPNGGACTAGPLESYGLRHELDQTDFLYPEPWWPTSFGTCFLFKDKVVLTARHVFCKDNAAMRALTGGTLNVVFGYEVTPDGHPANVFCEDRHVFAVQPIARFDCPAGGFDPAEDWIELPLAKKATCDGFRAPVNVSSAVLATDTPVYTLGHPNGVPLRYTETSLPLTLQANSFRAFLDAYDRSSGSPVFAARSHSVVGMIKRSSQPGGRVQVGEENRYVSELCLPGSLKEATLCVDSAAFPS